MILQEADKAKAQEHEKKVPHKHLLNAVILKPKDMTWSTARFGNSEAANNYLKEVRSLLYLMKSRS